MRRLFAIAISVFIAASVPALAQQENVPKPECLIKNAANFTEVGTGKYRKMGFNIYRATLWAPKGEYVRNKPFALQLLYQRSLSKDTVVGAVMDDVRAQNLADEATMDGWEKMLASTLSEVKNGDEIVALHVPGRPAKLFFNGNPIVTIADKRLSDSFFNIWLGDIANPDLKSQLMASVQ